MLFFACLLSAVSIGCISQDDKFLDEAGAGAKEIGALIPVFSEDVSSFDFAGARECSGLILDACNRRIAAVEMMQVSENFRTAQTYYLAGLRDTRDAMQIYIDAYDSGDEAELLSCFDEMADKFGHGMDVFKLASATMYR